MNMQSDDTIQEGTLHLCGHQLDPEYQAIQINGKYLRLRDKLWVVLLCLVENKSLLISRNDLINNYWGGNSLSGEQGITHTICHLRKMLKQYNIKAEILTIPKRGYVLQEGNDIKIY